MDPRNIIAAASLVLDLVELLEGRGMTPDEIMILMASTVRANRTELMRERLAGVLLLCAYEMDIPEERMTLLAANAQMKRHEARVSGRLPWPKQK